MKLIYTKSLELNGRVKTVRVYRDAEWEEYVVRYYSDNVWMDNSDYHTDDKEDAIDTAEYQLNDGREWDEANNLVE